MNIKKVFVWDIAVRVFHWLFALSFATAFISGLRTPLFDLHVVAGTLIFLLLLFRIVWGFTGTPYTRFRSFTISIKKTIQYTFATLFNRGESNFHLRATHNPASSLVFISMFVLVFISGVSGMLLLGAAESRGFAAPLKPILFPYISILEEGHELAAFATLFLVVAHLSGLLIDQLKHKSEIMKSMFHGYKLVDENEKGITSSLNVKLAISALLLLPVVTGVIFATSRKADYNFNSPPLVVKECGSCHMTYSANFLPSRNWVILMDGLEDHFGEDAAINDENKKEITDYLTKFGADKSLTKLAYYMKKSPDEFPPDTISFSETEVWEDLHDDIDEAIFKTEKVRTKANCAACHKDAEAGVFSASQIAPP